MVHIHRSLLDAGLALLPEQPERVRAWLAQLAKVFAHGDGEPAVEESLLGGPRRYTRADLVGESGIERQLPVRLWRTMGFADVGDDDVAFTDADRDALYWFERLRAEGLVPGDLLEAAIRAVGETMAGLADWQVGVLCETLGVSDVDEAQMRDSAVRLLPLVQQVQDYVWRRHLASAVGRLATARIEESHTTRTLVVGFADMVGFTSTTRDLSPRELTELIGEFEAVTADVITARHGRVVKHLGDEVLYTSDRPADGAEIALGLTERLAGIDTLPQLRIGMAVGPVVTRFGDVFGEVVNLAARLAVEGPPGRILVDADLAEALDGQGGYQLRPHRRLRVRGYRRLRPWHLTRKTG